MKISLSLADGSFYENVLIPYDMDELNQLLESRGFLKVVDGRKNIAVNSEFIVSIEF